MSTLISSAVSDSRRADKLAYHAICSLRDGDPQPSLLDATASYADYGPWAHTIASLALAYTSGGSLGAEHAYTLELAGSHELCLLMASFDDSHPLVKQLWSVAQLYDTSFPPLRWIVPGVLPTGLGFVSGRPKIGKSYLVMQVSGAVATGGVVFGKRVARGRVFYLGLEDTPRRLRDRLQQMGIPRDADITFATDWAPFSLGGAKDLLQEIGNGYTVVVVDTFSRAIGRADQMDATAMTLAMSQLHHIAAHEDVALLLVDHHRKSASMAIDSDPIDDIFGSTAKAGVVDVALGLYRKHGSPDATLKITGRDVEEQELALHWDAEHFNWVYKGDAEEHERTQRQAEVVNALQGLGWTSLRDLSDVTGQDRSNLHGRLQKLVEEGAVERKEQKGRVYYKIAAGAPPALGFEDLDIPAGDGEDEDVEEGLFDYAD